MDADLPVAPAKTSISNNKFARASCTISRNDSLRSWGNRRRELITRSEQKIDTSARLSLTIASLVWRLKGSAFPIPLADARRAVVRINYTHK